MPFCVSSWVCVSNISGDTDGVEGTRIGGGGKTKLGGGGGTIIGGGGSSKMGGAQEEVGVAARG